MKNVAFLRICDFETTMTKCSFLSVLTLATLILGGQAQADFIPLGSTYFIAPGAGVDKGFQVAGGPFVDSTFDFNPDTIGPDISGQGLIVSTQSLTDNGGGNFDLVFRIETDGNFLPAGTVGDSGEVLTTLGLFVGGGINAVDIDEPIIANTAQIEVFDTGSGSIGAIDVIDLSNFTTGIGGGWDGSVGLNFGSAIPVGDVGAIELQINFTAQGIPEPTTGLAVCFLISAAACRRRR